QIRGKETIRIFAFRFRRIHRDVSFLDHLLGSVGVVRKHRDANAAANAALVSAEKYWRAERFQQPLSDNAGLLSSRQLVEQNYKFVASLPSKDVFSPNTSTNSPS